MKGGGGGGFRFKSRHSSLLVWTVNCSWYIPLPVCPLSTFGFSGTVNPFIKIILLNAEKSIFL